MDVWVARAELIGCAMADQAVTVPGRDVHPALRTIKLMPGQENSDRCELVCEVEHMGDASFDVRKEIWALASDCIERVAARLSVAMWEPLQVRLKDVALRNPRTSGISQSLTYAPESGQIIRPPARVATDALSGQIEGSVLRALVWTRKALADEHPYDKFLGLVIACTIIATHHFRDGAPVRETECPRCGAKRVLKPSEREYLASMCIALGEDPNLAGQIWPLRSALVHGGVGHQAKTRFEVRDLVSRVEHLLQKAVERVTGGKLSFPSVPRGELQFIDYQVEGGSHRGP